MPKLSKKYHNVTIPSEFDNTSDGYIIIAPLSEDSKEQIYSLQDELLRNFPSGSLWLPKSDQLHITFAHIISPDSVYKKRRQELFQILQPEVVRVLKEIVPYPLSLNVKFDIVETFPAAIIVKGRDDGSYDRLRKRFTDSIKLPEQTRKPPAIIHSTIARFRDKLSFSQVHVLTKNMIVSFEEVISELQIIHEKRIFAQEHEVLARFPY